MSYIFLKIEVYPNCSDMNELGEIASPPKKNKYKYKNKYLSINLWKEVKNEI